MQAVCDRIVIINEGKILADEQTENITRTINENVKYRVKICGPQREVLEALRGVGGICHAEISSDRDRDCFVYHIEADSADARKNLFFTMAEKGWAIVGLEEEGVSLEDVFIKLTDTGTAKTKRGGNAK